MKLESLKPAEGSVRSRRRLGRGEGSGGGGTSRRGHKGAKSRTGYSKKLGFEGGQMPLQRRVPKFGFKSRNRIDYKPINLDTIQSLFDSTNETQIDLAFLVNHGLVDKKDIVKILGRGEISAKVNVSAHAFSKTAAETITKAGGTVTVINPFKKNAETLEVEVEAPTKMTAPKKADKEEAVKEAKTEVKEEAKAEVKEESKAKEETKEEPKAQKTTKKAKSEGDDLTKIEGIGPKIAELLNESGISTYAQLAAASVDEVTEILRNAGSRFSFHNPGTWGEQAQLAADGKWDELKELQDKLDGGRSE